MIAPGATLGMVGGGQLGRLFTLAAQSMGYRVTVLDPGAESPAGSVADGHVRAGYLDPEGLRQLARLCAAATTEFEKVPAEALRRLAERCPVAPTVASVEVLQDRVRQREFLARHGLATVPCTVVRGPQDLAGAGGDLYPAIMKVSRFGYEGKDQYRVSGPDEAAYALAAMGCEPCVLEHQVPIAREVAVVVARGADGQVAAFPVAENEHRHCVLELSTVPARIPSELAGEAVAVATSVAEALEYRGVLCVELFVLEDGRLLVSDVSPRPHNSGHYTLDACLTSQFEQQVRALCGLPLGDTRLHAPAVMVNLLGDLWRRGEPDWGAVLAHPRARLHLYGKREARPGRKMGHLTVLGDSVEGARGEALEIRARLRERAGLGASGGDPAGASPAA